MNKKNFIILFFLQCFCFSEDFYNIENALNFSVIKDREVYYAGENLYLNFDINIDKGYHIYSTDPTGSLSPTYVEISDSSLFSQIGILNEPIPNKKYDNNFSQDIYFHKGKFSV